jgi:trimethylamine monooxygenase
VVCFEKQDEAGGLWNYSWHTGTDKYGEQCHNSMYRYLWSNGPKEVLEMGDYTFAEHYGKPIGSYPPRAVLKDYVLGRGRKNNIDRFVRYSTAVRHIEAKGERFQITSQNLKTKEGKQELFDYVIVASGHFSVPAVPTYPGIDDFKGRIMHAHDFRDAVAFRGQKMLLIGNSYSAEDIALQCNKYGVEDISLSYRTNPTNFNWPKGIREIPQLLEYEDGYFHFVDGTKDTFDVVMFCTGYHHHFPYLTDDLQLENPKNLLFVDGLYKMVVLNKNPRVMYIGMTDQYYTFTMFDAQAFYARDYIMGKIEIEPDEKKRAEEIKRRGEKFAQCKSAHDEIDYQRDYVADLFKYCEYPEHKHAERAELLHQWKKDRHNNILTYRDQSFTSCMTGDVAPLPRTPWHKNMDDTLDGFVNPPHPC